MATLCRYSLELAHSRFGWFFGAISQFDFDLRVFVNLPSSHSFTRMRDEYRRKDAPWKTRHIVLVMSW